MLKSLSIHNIALIDGADIEFGSGLNILSGETGAGKSIILDSLGFILGNRADRTLIRHGENSAVVKAMFDISDNGRIKSQLDDAGLDVDDELLIVREMTLDGKNTCRINGEKVTLSMLKSVTKGLVDIYAQHDSAVLLDEDAHIAILDDYIGKNVSVVKSKLKIALNQLHDIKCDIDRIGALNDVYKRIDILNYEINEIKSANLVIGEEDELKTKSKMYANIESILEGLNGAYTILSGDDTDNNVLIGIEQVARYLGDLSEYNDEIEGLCNEVESAKDVLSDVARSVMILAENTEYDPYDAKMVDERLDMIRSLKRKYGNTIEEILAYLEKIESELDDYTNAEEKLAMLNSKYREMSKTVYEIALELSNIRQKGAKGLETALVANLNELGMKNSKFIVSFESLCSGSDDVSTITTNGLDRVVFLMSANLGQDPKPLSKVVSGGELSRFMLALKNINANLTNIDTMVFDEIDSGISGAIAYVVAEKLSCISVDRQVLAVTHLPQLGAMADHHYLIEKHVVGNTTKTGVHNLDNQSRLIEVARLMGGDSSELSIAHALEIVANADRFKSNR